MNTTKTNTTIGITRIITTMTNTTTMKLTTLGLIITNPNISIETQNLIIEAIKQSLKNKVIIANLITNKILIQTTNTILNIRAKTKNLKLKKMNKFLQFIMLVSTLLVTFYFCNFY